MLEPGTGTVTDCVRANGRLLHYTRRVALVAGAIAFITGLIGFLVSSEPLFAALLLTLQLYVLNVSPETLSNFLTWSAAFLAPLATINALLTVFSRTVGTWWRRFRFSKIEPDVVFLGGGNSATAIALRKYPRQENGCSTKPANIVFVDNAETPIIHEYLSELGCNVCDWHGNALSSDVLKSTNTLRASEVWVLTGDDRRNIEIAQNLSIARRSLSDDFSKDKQVMVNVYDQELTSDISFSDNDMANTRFFSVTRLAARHLLLTHAPPVPLYRDKGPLHIAIVGNGDLVAALVEQAVVHLVYNDEPQNCIHITLIGECASEQVKHLYQRLPDEASYPSDHAMSKLLPIVRLHAVDCMPSRINPVEWQASQRKLPFSMVYVTGDVDLNSMNWALRVASLRNLGGREQQTGIVACLSQASHEPAAVDAELGNWMPDNFVKFNTHECFSSADEYPGQLQDDEAKLIHLAYDVYDSEKFSAMSLSEANKRIDYIWSGVRQKQSTSAEEMPQVDALPLQEEVLPADSLPLEEVFRQSNRYAADHIAIKLMLLYPEHARKPKSELYSLALNEIAENPWSTAGDDLIDEQMLQLMKLEHRRFVVERLVGGWMPADKIVGDDDYVKSEKERKKKLKLNDTLVPYDELPPEEKLKDKLIVDAIPKILQLGSK